MSDLFSYGTDLFGKPVKPKSRGKMADRFTFPPFSVLNAREGAWQARKRAWIRLGIKGEDGRGLSCLGFSEAAECFGYERKGKKKPDCKDFAIGDKKTWERQKNNGLLGESQQARSHYRIENDSKFKGGLASGLHALREAQKLGEKLPEYQGQEQTGTSIFDPVLCELMYKWFCPDGGSILDPFAGGSTRGIVAGVLGHKYTGIELRQEQVEANLKQAQSVGVEVQWIQGDSYKLKNLVPLETKFDFVWTCPPYFDLEVYSTLDRDGSAFESYPIFMKWYESIFKQCVNRLKKNRFLAVTVGEIRDDQGAYRNFVGDNIACFRKLGLHYYNEIILVTAVGSLPIRAGKVFQSGRKIGKTHQNVLVFFKGDIGTIKNEFGKFD